MAMLNGKHTTYQNGDDWGMVVYDIVLPTGKSTSLALGNHHF